MISRLSPLQLSQLKHQLPSWTIQRTPVESITKEYRFKDYKECFMFMTRISFDIEQLDHHPEYFQCFNLLKVTLTTHDCDGLSERDLELATRMDHLFEIYFKK